jgi:aminoglycoside phosphotransferase (APT) family kinase protein
VHLEAKGLRWLEKLAPAGTITPLVFEDHEHHLLAMQAVPKPHDNWKELLLAGNLQADHVEQFARLLATVHRAGWQQRDKLSREFADTEFFESLRVEPYYLYTGAQVPEAARFIHELVATTRQRKLTIVHGDYSPKNILIHKDKLILLDHEVIHFGDPGFDLGFSMTHLLSKAHHLPALRQQFADATRAYWKTYRSLLGDVSWAVDLEPLAVRHTMACLLARVAGRSPLEYLSNDEKARQRAAMIRLMNEPPATISELVERFINAL